MWQQERSAKILDNLRKEINVLDTERELLLTSRPSSASLKSIKLPSIPITDITSPHKIPISSTYKLNLPDTPMRNNILSPIDNKKSNIKTPSPLPCPPIEKSERMGRIKISHRSHYKKDKSRSRSRSRSKSNRRSNNKSHHSHHHSKSRSKSRSKSKHKHHSHRRKYSTSSSNSFKSSDSDSYYESSPVHKSSKSKYQPEGNDKVIYNNNNKDDAASAIQKVWRGYTLRKFFNMKKMRRLTYEEYLERKQVGFALVERLINEFIESEFVPDLLMDILSEPKESKDWDAPKRSPRHFVSSEILEKLIDEVNIELSKEIIRSLMKELIDGYVINKMVTNRVDPMELVVGDILDEYVPSFLHYMIKECVSEIVTEYLDIQRATRELWLLLDPIIDDIAFESFSDDTLESYVENFIVCEISSTYSQIAFESLSEMRIVNIESKKYADQKTVQERAKTIIDTAILHYLLSKVGSKAEFDAKEQHISSLLNQQIAGQLVQKTLDIDFQLTTISESMALSLIFEDITNKAAMNVAMEQLNISSKAYEEALYLDEELYGTN